MNLNFKIEPAKLSEKYKFYYILWEMGCAGILIAWYARFAYIFTLGFLETHKISLLIMVIYEIMIVLFLLIRRMPKEVSFSLYNWVVALWGTVGATFFRPEGVNLLPGFEILMVTLQAIGLIISAIGLMSLAKSFGVVAANRGVKADGLYRYIRHPLYAGYVLFLSSSLIQVFSLYNAIIILSVFVFLALRIFAEERFLLQDPEYQAYAKSTKWRVIPYVW